MKKCSYLILALFIYNCADKDSKDESTTSVVDLAESYIDELINTYPITAYYSDIELDTHVEITSNKLSDIQQWEKFQDSLYHELSKIDFNRISERKDKITYWLRCLCLCI